MIINKQDVVTFINVMEKLYSSFTTIRSEDDSELTNNTEVASQILMQLEPIFKNNQVFINLFTSVYKLLDYIKSRSIDLSNIKRTRHMVLDRLTEFEVYLFSLYSIKVYLKDSSQLIKKIKSSENIIYYSDDGNLRKKLKENHNKDTISILINNEQNQENISNVDIIINEQKILKTYKNPLATISDIDYYLYDRLYLEAKLESLSSRQDIELLLAGSSYTMCGLFERDMLIPARNVAVDAQDLYYSIQTVKKSLANNPNIKYCVLSFAYYLWGYDLSLSTSDYQLKRITEVNYPVFLDSHNFPHDINEYDGRGSVLKYLNQLNPIYRVLFNYDSLVQKTLGDIKRTLVDAHYFSYPRTKNIISEFTEEQNNHNAKHRTDSHNKFFKYENTVKESVMLFEEFVRKLQNKNVQLLVYVPPVSTYYRKYIDKELVENYYKLMNPLIEKYKFNFIDLFNSDIFSDEDFYDYDHLNDFGAKKLGETIVSILRI